MIARVRALLRGDRRDAGIALPTVIGLGLVMLLMVAGSLTAVTGAVQKTGTSENTKSAMSAAYAGVQEYQSRLANDSTYFKFGNPNAAFSATSRNSLTLPTGPNANPAFGISASDGWAAIPDPTTGAPSGASFRYAVDNSDYATKGIIRLQSTGRDGNSTATLVANLRQSGFIDYLYFTDYETGDPLLTNSTQCGTYGWQTPTRPSSCNITFAAGDHLAGPVHSNDEFSICGSTFDSKVGTSAPNGAYLTSPGCSTTWGTYNGVKQTGPVYEKSLDMPPTNSQLKRETRTDVPADVPNPGCLYTGPTQIRFYVDPSTGKGMMNVVSPYTKVTQTIADANGYDIGGSTPSQCGDIVALHQPAGANIPVLDLNLIFVQAVPPLTNDPNYWPATGPTSTPSGLTCLSVTQGGRYSGGFSFGSSQYPSANEILPDTSTTAAPAYSCRNGDLYVGGTLKGHTTLASANFIYAVSSIYDNDKSSDILGLVGQNGVWLWNPVIQTTTQTQVCTFYWYGNCYSYSTSTSTTYSYGNPESSPELDAAILSVGHTFMVQNYDGGGGSVNAGARGTLTVLGAIAQKYRGPVAMSSGGSLTSGFLKNYKYDTRFLVTAPPKFLNPVSTTYGVTQYSGVKAAYNAAGAPQ